MVKSKEITYLVKIQRKDKNSWKVYCECETLQLAEKVAYGLSVPYHITRKTVETTFEMIKEQN